MNNLLETLIRAQRDCWGLFRLHTTDIWLPVLKKDGPMITVIVIDELLTASIYSHAEYKGKYVEFPDGKNLFHMLSTPREMEEFKKQLKTI